MMEKICGFKASDDRLYATEKEANIASVKYDVGKNIAILNEKYGKIFKTINAKDQWQYYLYDRIGGIVGNLDDDSVTKLLDYLTELKVLIDARNSLEIKEEPESLGWFKSIFK